MLYNIDYALAALVLSLIIAIFYFYKSSMLKLNSKLFGLFIVTVILAIIVDIAGAFTISYANRLPIGLNVVISFLYFLLQLSLSVIFMLYAMSLVGCLKPCNLNKVIAFSAPVLLPLFLIFSSPFNNFIFYFDEQMNYYHGRYFLVLYFSIVYFVVVGFGFLIFNLRRLRKLQFIIVITHIFFLAFAMAIQFFYPEYLLNGAAVALFLLTMYLTFQNPESYVDIMTGLYGRKAFLLFTANLLRKKKPVDLVLINLNNIKFVNTVFGIKSGDNLILQVAEYLDSLCSHKHVFRINGDQFGILVMKDTLGLISRIQERFSKVFLIGNSDMILSFNICKISISQYASTQEEILTLVESTFLLLKRRGDNTVLELDQEMVNLIHRDFAVETALRKAIHANALEVYFQPIVNAVTGKPCAVEALLRLYDKELGFVPPSEFIIIAEQKGLINAVGEIVIEKTCRFVSENKLWESGITLIHINLSTVQCMDIHLHELILSTIHKFQLPTNILNFEITETAAATSPSQLLLTMNQLIKQNISFSMDDYGSGFSNNKTLTELPFDAIKIDREMLWSCSRNHKARVLYKHVVNMIKQMDMHVIAEGVESAEQAEMVRNMGVDYIQGYFYSRPLDEKKFLQYLAQHF